MDADHFDALARSLFAPRSRRSLAAVPGLFGLFSAGDAEAGKKGKKGGDKKGGKKGDGKKGRKKHCVSFGESCTFAVQPCCKGECCEVEDGLRQCVDPGACCIPFGEACSNEYCCGAYSCCRDGKCTGVGVKCSTDTSIDCCQGLTCKNRDSQGFGTCLL